MKECTTAVVLAAGLGSRMRREASAAPLSEAQAAAAARGLKGMIPDGRGRPFLDHVLSSLADGGVTDVCLIVGRGSRIDSRPLRAAPAAARHARLRRAAITHRHRRRTARGGAMVCRW